jgi:lysozyme
MKVNISYFFVIFFIFCFIKKYAQNALINNTLKGIDVSHHQGIILWDSVITENISFAMVKATEGYTFKDTLFAKNWEELKRVGIKRGAYHFFRGNSDPKKQAQNFIETVKLDSGDIVPILDIEKLDKQNVPNLVKKAKIWLNEIENEYKVKPMIYAGQFFYNKYLAFYFKGYPLWIAEFTRGKPVLRDKKKYFIWQHSELGIIKGIKGRTDLNRFYGDIQSLEKICKK